MQVSDLEGNARFQMLSEMDKEEYRRAMNDPEIRGKVILSELVWQGGQIQELASNCRQKCQPRMEERLNRLERFKARVIGIGLGIGGIAAVLGALWGIMK